MFKRLNIYLREMYPLIPRIILGAGIIFAIEGLVVLNARNIKLSLHIQEITAFITVFGFFLALRIADELKDLKTDLINFPKRPLPSGRVKKSDIITLLILDLTVMVILNLIFMSNWLFLLALLIYGCLMSVWFFAKRAIQSNLLLALATHNPVQFILVWYVISFICQKYNLPIFTLHNLLIALAFYLPGLVWEISRKICSPKDEGQYVTYSRLLGFRTAAYIVLMVLASQFIIFAILLWHLSPLLLACLALPFLVMAVFTTYFSHHPQSIKFGKVVEIQMYVSQLILVVGEAIILLRRSG